MDKSNDDVTQMALRTASMAARHAFAPPSFPVYGSLIMELNDLSKAIKVHYLITVESVAIDKARANNPKPSANDTCHLLGRAGDAIREMIRKEMYRPAGDPICAALRLKEERIEKAVSEISLGGQDISYVGLAALLDDLVRELAKARESIIKH